MKNSRNFDAVVIGCGIGMAATYYWFNRELQGNVLGWSNWKPAMTGVNLVDDCPPYDAKLIAKFILLSGPILGEPSVSESVDLIMDPAGSAEDYREIRKTLNSSRLSDVLI